MWHQSNVGKILKYFASAEGIMALQDPNLRALYDLKVCLVIIRTTAGLNWIPERYLFNAIPI